jgi:hypothetical protein
MVSLKLLHTVGASILAFMTKDNVLVERDSTSGPGSHFQNSPVNRPGASFV